MAIPQSYLSDRFLMRTLGTNSAFRTDADISASVNHSEKVLQPWVPEAGADIDLSLESSGQTDWDQFEANKRLFGASSTYDENLYTTQIDRSAPRKLPRFFERHLARFGPCLGVQPLSEDRKAFAVICCVYILSRDAGKPHDD